MRRQRPNLTPLEMEQVDNRESLKPFLDTLSPRERKVLVLRFFGEFNVQQIAAEVGLVPHEVDEILLDVLQRSNLFLLDDPPQ